MGTRISTDLADPRLMRLLKAEAHERDTTVKDVLSRALEAYFRGTGPHYSWGSRETAG